MTTAVIPVGPRPSVLLALKDRRDVAMELLYAAEEAGNEKKWRAATERFWLRELQIKYVEERPADGLCMTCVYADEGWLPDILTGTLPVWACLVHWNDVLAREAAELAAKARWFGRR